MDSYSISCIIFWQRGFNIMCPHIISFFNNLFQKDALPHITCMKVDKVAVWLCTHPQMRNAFTKSLSHETWIPWIPEKYFTMKERASQIQNPSLAVQFHVRLKSLPTQKTFWYKVQLTRKKDMSILDLEHVFSHCLVKTFLDKFIWTISWKDCITHKASWYT